MTTARSTERRILEAALLVLAGCPKSQDAQSSDVGHVNATNTTTVALPREDLTVAGDPSPTQVPNVVASAELKPGALCAQYKETVKVDTTRVKKMQVEEYAPEARAEASWDSNRKLVLCTIVRARDDVTIEVTRVPTCCNMGGGPPQPCPQPFKQPAPGWRVVLERAELHPDGKVASSRLELHGYEKNPQGRHACGRQPEGFVLAPQVSSTTRIGAELALMASLEAASVPAFQRLARELHVHGAPTDLVERACRAAEDEVRHARLMAGLARAHGAVPSDAHPAELGVRSLLPIAIENAVEGCVREAYGALVASFQAERAAPELRNTFAAVAVDERAHAALSEDVDRWLAGELGEAARAEVAVARQRALSELRASLEHATACDTLGLPDSATAVALLDAYLA